MCERGERQHPEMMMTTMSATTATTMITLSALIMTAEEIYTAPYHRLSFAVPLVNESSQQQQQQQLSKMGDGRTVTNGLSNGGYLRTCSSPSIDV